MGFCYGRGMGLEGEAHALPYLITIYIYIHVIKTYWLLKFLVDYMVVLYDLSLLN